MVIPARPHSAAAVVLMRNYESTNWGLIVSLEIQILTGLMVRYLLLTNYGMVNSVKMKDLAVPLSLLHGSVCMELSNPTTDDIKVRICGSESTSNEDTPIELLQIYVQ